MRALSRFWTLALVGVLAAGCSQATSIGDQCISSCPTPDRPWLHLECPLCVDLIPPPVIRDVGVFPPGGGKVPLQSEFCADVEFAVPELADQASLHWDVTGDGLPDVESATDECPLFTYDSCDPANILVSVTAIDRFGRAGAPVERSLTLSCNQVPTISCAVIKQVAQPRPGDNLQFFISAVDPDATDPGNDGGIERFEIDFDGDGIFDQTIPGNRQQLPVNHSYALAGQFRPTVRAYDADGEFGEGTCDPVSILEELISGDAIDLRFDLRDLVPLPDLPAPFPATTAIALSGDRIAALSNDGTGWLFDAINALPEDFTAVDRAGGSMIGLGAGLYTSIFDGGAPTTAITDWSACTATTGGGDRLTVAVTTAKTLAIVEGGGAVRVFDASAAMTAPVGMTCSSLLSTVANPVSTPPIPGLAVTWATERAVVADRTLYAAITTRETGGNWGVVTYDLNVTPPTVWCPSGGTGCLVTSSPVDALAARGSERIAFALTRPAFWHSGTGAITYSLPRRALWPASATARIWMDALAVAPGVTTFTFADDQHIQIAQELASSATFLTATTAVVSYDAEPQIALAGADGTLSVYDVVVTGGGPSWMPRSTVSMPAGADELVHDGQYLYLLNRTATYDATAPTFTTRQRRGAWAWPLDGRSGWVRIVPARRGPRDTASYTGPTGLVVADGDIWIADGEYGVQRLPRVRLQAVTQGVSSLAVDADDDLAIGGPVEAFAAVPEQLRTLVATSGGVGQVRFDRGSDGRPVPALEWLLPATRPIVDVSLLATSDGRHLVAMATTEMVEIAERRTPRQVLLRAPAAETGAIRHVELLSDPDDAEPYVLYTFESDGRGSVVLQGIDDAPLRLNARRSRFLQDLGATFQSHSLGFRPLVLSRLTPGQNVSRTMAMSYLGFERLCIEPFWGGDCPVDHLGNTVVLIPRTTSGEPWPLTVRGRRLIVRTDAVSGLLTIQDRDGLVVRADFAPCASIEETLQFACVSGMTMRAAADADPFWLQATDFGIFVFDMSNPIVPRLVTSDFVSGRQIHGLVGVADGTDLLVGYHCDGAGSTCSNDDNAVIRTFFVRGIVAP